ncbi:MAG: xanthine dehydrogenase family protein subunit M [Desulfurococcales archaeon]|nr:xanthine dehydrogenase family protein subunit M [Desulfurococcales archaeon]
MFYRIPKFNYYRASTLNEALDLVSSLNDFKVLAGGTDLVIDLKVRRYTVKNVVDISRIKELDYIADDGDRVRIGALTKLQSIADSPIIREKAPVLADAVREMASWQIRNVATIGGNLCNASPAADTAPPLYVLNATLRLVSKEGEREVPITEFFLGPRKTALRSRELLKEIVIPHEPDCGASFLKLGRRNSFTLSVVAVATLVKVDKNKFADVRIALNSVAPTPVRARKAEECLKGKEISLNNITEAAKLVLHDISPISDVRASAEYRKDMSVVLTRDSLIKSLERVGIKV